MEWESDNPFNTHTCPRQVCRSPGRRSSWELEFRDCGGISGWGLLLTTGRQIKGMWERRLWWICLWRKTGQPWKQGDPAESCIRGGAITIASLSPHISMGSWTIERLAHQTPDGLNYRAGPHPGCSFKGLKCQSTVGPQPGGPLYVPDMQNNREGP